MLSIALLSFMAFSVSAADLGGKIGVGSDNYFRGHNISDGVGHYLGGHADLYGLNASVGLMSMADDGDYLRHAKLGYGLDLAGMKIKLSYHDFAFQGSDIDGWNEIGVAADLGLFGVRYHKGLDDAGDFYAINSGILKFAKLEYGDWDDGGSYWKIYRGFDALGGKVKIGYVDHEDSDEDFVDQLYVGYQYKF